MLCAHWLALLHSLMFLADLLAFLLLLLFEAFQVTCRVWSFTSWAMSIAQLVESFLRCVATLRALIETGLLQLGFRLRTLQLAVSMASLLHFVFTLTGGGVAAACRALGGRLMSALGVADETMCGLLAFVPLLGTFLDRSTVLLVLETLCLETALLPLLQALVFHHTPVDRLLALLPIAAAVVACLFVATSLTWFAIALAALHKALVLLQASRSTLLLAERIFHACALAL